MTSKLSQAALGRALDLSPAAITKLKGQGMPVDSVAAARKWRAKHLNIAQRKPAPAAARGKAPPKASAVEVRHEAARTSREEAAAQREHLALLRERQVLVNREKVREEIARRLAGLRDGLLQIPARLQSVLAAETDEAKCHDLLQDELYLVLGQFAEGV